MCHFNYCIEYFINHTCRFKLAIGQQLFYCTQKSTLEVIPLCGLIVLFKKKIKTMWFLTPIAPVPYFYSDFFFNYNHVDPYFSSSFSILLTWILSMERGRNLNYTRLGIIVFWPEENSMAFFVVWAFPLVISNNNFMWCSIPIK